MDTTQIIKGYEIKERIGKGGYGAVYLVQKENQQYALKKITDLNKNEIENYQKLLDVLIKLKSEYVIKYYESFVEKDCLYIIMEYGGNTDLKKYIEERFKKNNLIDEKIIINIIKQICLGLKEIHKNKLIHRDLTPENIFMDKNNKIKIGDFGVSKITTTLQNYAMSLVGKYQYFAPEMDDGNKYNNKIDIYALGCIIYELLTLKKYYNIKNKKEAIKIDIDIYNQNWLKLIDLTLKDDYNQRPNIEEIYNYINSEIIKNEIICTYNKKDKNGINILHNFEDALSERISKSYKEAKNNINEKNIEIYVKDEKIKFNYKYESDEIGLIKIKFKFTKLLTSSAFMFSGCRSLESIDLSSFNTDNITDMSYMFSSCYLSEPINFFSINFKKCDIIDVIPAMLYWSFLYKLDNFLDLYDNKNVNTLYDTNIKYNGYSSLKTIDLSSFNTSNVINMSHMFCGCGNLESIDLSSFNTKNVINMNSMFYKCESLTSLNLSSFNTVKVTDMSNMFSFSCRYLDSLNLSSFNTSNVTNMSRMFKYCSLKSLNLSSFNTVKVTDMSEMFSSCEYLKSIDLSSFNTSNVTDMSHMFRRCCYLESLNLSSFNTKSVINMNSMFYDCEYLKSLNLSSFNTKNVTDMYAMFYYCKSLTSLNISSFNTNNLKIMSSMFGGCSSLVSLDLSSFNTNNVTDMGYIFLDCSSLKSLNLSSLKTNSDTYMYGMFKGCNSLKKENIKINKNEKNILKELGPK